jgi:DNA-binding NarL/FixJ family response regulator
MKLLVISSNPLFTEVLNASLEKHDNYAVSVVDPREFTKALVEVEPDVIIVDEDLGQAVYEPILTSVHEKASSHIILLNPKDNRLCVLDSRRSIIQEVDDLCQAIGQQIPNVSSTHLPQVDQTQSSNKASADAIKEVDKQPG